MKHTKVVLIVKDLPCKHSCSPYGFKTHVWSKAGNLFSVSINNYVFMAITQLFLLYVFMSRQLLYISLCWDIIVLPGKKWPIALTNDSKIAFMRDNRNQIFKFDGLFYGVRHIYYEDYINIQ